MGREGGVVVADLEEDRLVVAAGRAVIVFQSSTLVRVGGAGEVRAFLEGESVSLGSEKVSKDVLGALEAIVGEDGKGSRGARRKLGVEVRRDATRFEDLPVQVCWTFRTSILLPLSSQTTRREWDGYRTYSCFLAKWLLKSCSNV